MKTISGIQSVITPSGARFTVERPTSDSSGSTLLLFHTFSQSADDNSSLCRLGDLLHSQGWNIVTMDLPCQGGDLRSGEREGPKGWAARLGSGEDIVAGFQTKVADVIDYLVTFKIADPWRMVAAGTSYGAFMALHATAANSLIRGIVAHDPIVELSPLPDFSAIQDHTSIRGTALIHHAEALANKETWIAINETDAHTQVDRVRAFAHALATHKAGPDSGGGATLTFFSLQEHERSTDWDERAATWVLQTITNTVRILPSTDHSLAVPCTIYPPAEMQGRRSGLVVHLYGSGGSHVSYNLRRPAYAELRHELREAGYWVVVPELGPSHWMNKHTAATLDAVISTMLSEHEIDAGRVHLFGTSMGGGSSLIYARTRTDVLSSVCAIFPMTDFEAWVGEAPRYLSPVLQAHNINSSNPSPALRAISPLHNVADFIGLPIYVLHGDTDEIVPVHHGREFAKFLKHEGGLVTYQEIHGATHDDDIAIGQQDNILKFLGDAEAQKQRIASPA